MKSDSNKNQNLILIQLNEINFDVVYKYIQLYPQRFKGFKRLIDGINLNTMAEESYEYLEPWIQWVSVHTGKSYDQHKVFRLGDIVNTKEDQIFEIVEKKGYKVGAISPMNAKNNLKNSSYFIPDPWTKTKTDNSRWSKALSLAISQVVNDNSKSKLTFKSALIMLLGLIRFARFKHYGLYIYNIINSRRAPWRKALALDLFLHDIHLSLYKNYKPNFSTLFLNSGAHIQHHYFFNCSVLKSQLDHRNPSWYIDKNQDPFLEMLDIYNVILLDIQDKKNTEYIIATGLSQKPYNKVKYYYRLKNHSDFISKLGIKFKSIYPRMTRDFLIEFSSKEEVSIAQKILSQIKVNNKVPMFGKVDNRGLSLFVTLTFPDEVGPETSIVINSSLINLNNEVVFVAIKNGMHQTKGFSFYSKGLENLAPPDNAHVKDIFQTINNFLT